MCKNMMLLILPVSLLVPVSSLSAADIYWTSTGQYDNLWDSKWNWNPQVVPGPTDTAFINPPPERGPVIDSDVTVGYILGPRFQSDDDQIMDIVWISGRAY